MSVSSRIALYAALPAIFILLVGVFAALVTQSLEARVSIISTVTTSVTLLFLISENLRQSANRKLDFLNKRALTPALGVAKQGLVYSGTFQLKTLSKCQDVIRKQGKFLRVKLYPANLLDDLEKTRDEMSSYVDIYKQIEEAGNKAMGSTFNVSALYVTLGLEQDNGNWGASIEKHKAFLKSEKPLGDEFARSSKGLANRLNLVREEIEAFFDANQLEEFKERTVVPFMPN